MYDDYYDDDPGPDLNDMEFICQNGHPQPTEYRFCEGPSPSPNKYRCGKHIDNTDPDWHLPCTRCGTPPPHDHGPQATHTGESLPPGVDCSWSCVPKRQRPSKDPWDEFSEPGGNSALRCATYGTCWTCGEEIDDTDDYCRHCGARLNPRKHPCPGCDAEAVLTTADKARGYVCDRCADMAEGRLPQY